MKKGDQKTEQKLCCKALDTLLNLVDIFGDDPSAFVFAYPGIGVSAGFKDCIPLRPEPLKREYLAHIPTCPDCRKVYDDFLKNRAENEQEFYELDKKHLGLYQRKEDEGD